MDGANSREESIMSATKRRTYSPRRKGLSRAERALYTAYQQHKYRCNSHATPDRNGNRVTFDLTYEQWLSIWQASGKLHLRGCHKGCYVMSRKDDLGSYTVGNVYIQSHVDNVLERVRRDAALKHAQSQVAALAPTLAGSSATR